MKVRMVTQMSGVRHDGRPWPGPGNDLDVTNEEGAYLVHNGIAVPVTAAGERRAGEMRPSAPDPSVETRAEDAEAGAKEEAQAKPRARKA